MRRLALGAAILAASAVSSRPVAAFVQPAAGTVLPDYDIRKDTAAVGQPRSALNGGPTFAARIGDGDAGGSIRPVVVEPTSQQLQAMERLRRTFAPNLKVEFKESNGLPRQLHSWGKPLSAPSALDPVTIARNFLRANSDLFRLTASEIDALMVVRNYPTGNVMRTVWLGQAVDGVLVDRGEIRFALDREGRVVWSAAGDVQPGIQVGMVPRIGPEEAVRAAAEGIGRSLDGGLSLKTSLGTAQTVFSHPEYLGEIIVAPLVFPMWNTGAVLGWQVLLEPAGLELPQWYAVTVDARTGKLLARVNLYKYANNTGLVFAGEYPNTVPNPPFTGGVPQTEQNFGYQWPSTVGHTIPAPYGLYNFTIGNNVDAKEDWVRDNETTAGQRADGGALQEFLFPFTDAYQRSTATTQAGRIADAKLDLAAVTTNLFYMNNWWHDYVYKLGFDEAAGNFQMDNFSRGGCGKDAVLADAQDGASPASGNPSLNNANFGTPPESITCSGTIARPRMNMFLWELSGASVLRDGDVDNTVIVHEYHHGISIRLVGGPYVGCMGGTQSGAMGEGGGDWEAASAYNSPRTGAYAVNDPVAGIRNYAMDNNPRTYAELCSLGGCQVHNDGEIHASVMWDHRVVMGKAITEQLAIDAYKLVPCSPSFLDYRDAMVLADELRYAGAHVCDIWSVALARGMGFDAKGADSSYAVADFLFNAPKCSGAAHLRYEAHTATDTTGGNGDGLYALGETIDLNVELQNFDGVSTATGVSATVSTTTPGITMVTANRSYPTIAAGAKANPTAPFQFRIDPGFICGSPIDFSVSISWAPGLTRSDDFTDRKGSTPGILIAGSDAEGAPLAMAAPAALSTAQNHTTGGSQSYYMLSGCYAGDEVACTGAGACNDTCPTLTMAPVGLPAYQSTWISFWARYNLEYSWDGIFVELSDDGGASWQMVPTLNYPGTIVAQAGVGCDVQADAQAVTGPPLNDKLEAWTKFEGDLTAWAGKNVLIRIRQTHDGCVYFEGSYIDDIELRVQNCTASPFVLAYVSAKNNNDGVAAACTDNDNSPDPGETVDALITVTNTGNATATNMSGTLSSTSPNITIVSGPQSFGTLAPGQSGSATFRYSVANPGPVCFEAAPFRLALDANGGAYTQNIDYTETLRQDTGTGSWLDNFEGGQAPWTPTLGPIGSAQDWALREMDCLSTGGNRWFWATNQGIVRTVCATGEPDYSNESDSVLTSPLIDLGAPGMKLVRASWNAFGLTTSVANGFVEVAIDHDNDGTFTPLWNVNGGFGVPDGSGGFSVDIQNNPAAAPITPPTTAQFVRWQFRFRSIGADPGATGDSVGMFVNDFQLEWQLCDANACAPGIPRRLGIGRSSTGTDGIGSGTMGASTAGDPAGSSQP